MATTIANESAVKSVDTKIMETGMVVTMAMAELTSCGIDCLMTWHGVSTSLVHAHATRIRDARFFAPLGRSASPTTRSPVDALFISLI